MARRYKTVASPIVLGLMRLAEVAGVGPAEFTARTGVSVSDVLDPSGRVERPAYERVLEVGCELLERPAAAVSCGDLTWVQRAFPLLAVAWLNAPTARCALAAVLRYRPFLGESDRVTVRERDGTMQVRYEAEGPPRYAGFQALSNFAIFAAVLRTYDQGGRVRRFAARVSGPCAPAFRGVAEWLGGAVEFGGNEDLLQFSTAALDAPSPQHSPALHRVISDKLERDLAELARGASPSLAVERALRVLLGHQVGGSVHRAFERVCAELRLTPWTLRRRLGAEGVTFGALYARARLDLARDLLGGTSCPLAEVSDRLGFTSPSAFARFFHRLEGVTPGEFRAALERRLAASV